MTDDTLALIERLREQGVRDEDLLDEVQRLRECECCGGAVGKRKAGVASIPGVPMSILWCVECIKAQVVPLWVTVAETAEVGGYDNLAEPYRELVDDTIKYFQVPPLQFHWMVACAIRDFEREMDAVLTVEPAGVPPAFPVAQEG